jgi:hypothetical protein
MILQLSVYLLKKLRVSVCCFSPAKKSKYNELSEADMTRNMIIIVATFCTALMLSSGCKKSEDNMALLSALGGGPDVYAGSSPGGDFIEVTIDRSKKKVNYTN